MSDAVIITGAYGGIGRALVSSCRNAGLIVIATGRDADPPADLECDFYVSADLKKTVDDAAYADAVFAQIRECLNGHELKALVNNAAAQILGRVEELTRDDWHTTLNVNLLAPFLWSQAFIEELSASSGSILNISSIHAHLTKREFVAYATSKAALSGMTRAMAVDLGSKVRVNAIEPAAIETDMLRAGFEGNQPAFDLLKAYHPVGRIGGAAEVGDLAVMLITGDFPFLNGAVIGLDGGIQSVLHDPGM